MAHDPIGHAMLDFGRGEYEEGACRHIDGGDEIRAHIHENYFTPREEWYEDTLALLESLEGPVVDVGCGAGQHALWLRDHGVAVEAFDLSPGAVEATRERGVEDARVMDMFDMDFPRDRFRTALVNGTQAGLAGSLPGVRAFLSDLASVADDEGVVVVDSYDPGAIDPAEFFGYRPDPRRGIARRAFHAEYERDGEREVGRTLSFVLFSPDRLRDIAVGTPWDLDEVIPREGYYKAVLTK